MDKEDAERFEWAAGRLKSMITGYSNQMHRVVGCIENKAKNESNLEEIDPKELRELGELIADISEGMEELLQSVVDMKEIADKSKEDGPGILH